MSSSVSPKAKYKTTNYRTALKARSLLTIWLDSYMQWLATPNGKRDRLRTFSEAAIQLPEHQMLVWSSPASKFWLG